MRKVAAGAVRGALACGVRRRGVVPLPRPNSARNDGWGCGEAPWGRRFGGSTMQQSLMPVAASSLQCALASAAARGYAGDVALAPNAYAEFRPTKVRRIEDTPCDENSAPQSM
jgi:hypothetical protein